jgi:hypothetical protein
MRGSAFSNGGDTMARARKQASRRRTRRGQTRSLNPQPLPPKTKEQLYAEAKRLGIEGRSKMTKAQLQRAIARRR